MTPTEAYARLRHLQTLTSDDEAAHAFEDAFRHDVLQAIADGSPDAVELAQYALATESLVFARWCA